jgi:hypothetical protein
VEDALVSCFPDLPEDKTWEKKPDVVQDGIVEGEVAPVSYGVPYAASVPVGPAHDLGPLIPDLLAVATAIEEMLFGFLLAMA